jgi:hypothetical protein
MTPDEVDALDDEVYAAFVRHMQREAYEIEKASRAAQRR